MKKLFLFHLLFVLFHASHIQAQTSVISGFIKDIETNEKLINASIYELNSKKGAITNDYGYYSLRLTNDKPVRLVASFVGYTSDTLSIDLIRNEKFDFLLLNENKLDEVVIKSRNQKPIEKRNDMGLVSISIKKIKALPAIGGESDVIKALQLMPGIQAGKEGSSNLFVRGGSPDQNLVTLDDVPLYYVNHMGGFVSVFNTDAIKNIKLLKGGFPASYGGRLSSVVDIRMKEGNANNISGNGMIGMLASKISIEGPIKKQKTSYIFSARRMLYDMLINMLSYINKNEETTTYRFFDLNAKINHQFSENDHLYLSSYLGNDKFITKEYSRDASIDNSREKTLKNSGKWGNMLLALRWNHLFSQKLFSNTTFSYTHFGLTVNDEEFNLNNSSFYNYKSGIYDFHARIDFDYFQSPDYSLKFGVVAIKHKFNPGKTDLYELNNNTVIVDTTHINKQLESFEYGAYLENKIKITNELTTNLGLRYNKYLVKNKNYHSLEPRFLMNWNFYQNAAIKLSYSEMQQNIHLLTTGGIGMPIDTWMPATQNAPPERSKQLAIGYSKSIKDGTYELSIETYYKKSKNLITYKEGASIYNISDNWEEIIENDGKGTAYGLEILLQKKEGKHTGWLAYTLAKSDRQFDKLNFGKTYPYHYDKRHDLSLVYQYKINRNINFSATWNYATGNAISIAEARYYLLSDPTYISQSQTDNWTDVHYYNGKNGFRMRDFHKLDLAISFKKEKKWGERSWNISIYNVYNRQNPYYYFFVNEYKYDTNGVPIEGSQKLKLKQKSLFPIFPSVSYSFSF